MSETTYNVSDSYDSLDEFVMHLTKVIMEVNDEIYSESSCLIELMNTSDPVFTQFEELPAAGILSIKKISEAFERSSATNDKDDSEIKVEFWRFLMHQLQVRADTLRASSLALEKPNSNDCNSSITYQTQQLVELSRLIEECDGWGRIPGRIETDSANASEVKKSGAVPLMVA